MGMWGGIRQGLETFKKDKLDEEQMEIRRSQEERADAEFELRSQQSQVELYESISKSLGINPVSLPAMGEGKVKGGLTTEHMINVLEEIGVDSDVLINLHAAGGTAAGSKSALKSAYDIAMKVRTDLKTGKYEPIEGSVSEIIGNMISTAVITNPEETPLDDAFWKKAETDIGITISEDMRNRFGDFSTTPGSVTFLNAPVLREKASLPDIKLAKGMAKESVIAQASSELNIILAEQSKIQTIESNAGPLVPGGTPEEEEEAQQRIAFLKQFYENRSNIILEAQSLFKDNEDPNGLYRIYGTAALRPLYDRIGYFNPVILGEQFEQSRTVPIGVGNSKLYAELYTLGLVKDGQTVSYEGPDGNTITEIVGS